MHGFNVKLDPLKELLHIPLVFSTILYRQALYRIKKRKLNFSHANVDAPIGIIGQPNKITWNAQNVIYAKVSNGKKNTLVTKNEFHFINSNTNKKIGITCYGINQKSVKTFDLHFLEVQKNPPPEPFFKKENGLKLYSEFKTKNVIPSLKPYFSIRPSTIEITTHIPEKTELKIVIHPLDLSELTEEILQVDKEQNLNILTNTLKNEKRLLPQPDPRPYHEAIMESRWFG